MSLEHDLTLTDRERVRETLSQLAGRLNRKLNLHDLIDEWRHFAVAVNQGYRWSLETYNRDVAIRDMLEEIAESLSMSGRQRLMDDIRESDQDFILATWDPDRPLDTFSPQLEIGWWQYRVPRYPGGKLFDDLQELGYPPYIPAEPDSNSDLAREFMDFEMQSPDTIVPPDSQAQPT